MADKITFDFETGHIFIDMPGEKGELECPDLKEKKSDILAAAGLEPVDLSGAIRIIEDLINGRITETEFLKQIQEECQE